MSFMDKRKDHGTGQTGFDPIPEGDYVFEIAKSSLAPNKAKNGKILTLEMTVISEQSEGRKVFARLNVENPNPTAERIGLEQLNQLIEASGIGDPEDEADLVGVTVGARVKIRADEGYQPDNDVSYFKDPDKCDLENYKEAPASAKPAEKAAKKWDKKKSDDKPAEAKEEKKADKPAKKPWEKK